MRNASDPNSKARFAATCSAGIRRQVMQHIFGFRFSFWRACMVMGLLAIAQSAFAQENWSSRVARLNYVQGDVSFQPGGESDWAWATLNRLLKAAGFGLSAGLKMIAVDPSLLDDVPRILRLTPEERLREAGQVSRFIAAARRV